MKIILDAMGGDNAPQAAVLGAVLAAREIEDEIVLLGPKDKIKSLVDEYKDGSEKGKLTVFPAYEVIENNESPTKAIKKKPDSTIAVGLSILKDGLGDVFVSAGSTGALLVGGMLQLGCIKGVSRPAICSVYPTLGGKASVLLDCGANAECKPKYLAEFAVMGSVYVEKVMDRKDPTVALVNIGAEAKKGTPLTQKAYELISEAGVNFTGNVEARDIPLAPPDVIVTDGFTGNIVLKLTEGMGFAIGKMLAKKAAATGESEGKTGGSLSLDYSVYGGAPLLGLSRPVVKMHGSSDSIAVRNTLLKAQSFAAGGVNEEIEKRLGK